MKPILSSALPALFALASAHAGITGVNLGTDAPPATLGGFALTPYAPDPRGERNVLRAGSLVPSLTGNGDQLHQVEFSSPVFHTTVGESWLSWSHGYNGDVYVADTDSLGLDLPDSTLAFVLYLQPNEYDVFEILVNGSDGSQVFDLAGMVNGLEGAQGFGFYATGESRIRDIMIHADSEAFGFAVGEFSVAAIPEMNVGLAGWIVMLAAGGLLGRRRRSARI